MPLHLLQPHALHLLYFSLSLVEKEEVHSSSSSSFCCFFFFHLLHQPCLLHTPPYPSFPSLLKLLARIHNLLQLSTSGMDLADKKPPPSPSPSPSSSHSRFILKSVSGMVSLLLLSWFCCQYVAFFEPVVAFVLGRLWDVLYFVILTTAVSIGIMNSRGKDLRDKDHRARSRMISGLGAAIFGDTEQNDEDEVDLQEAQSRTPQKQSQQQKKAPAEEDKKQDGPIAGALHAEKLVTTVMAGVTHIASFRCAIENLALHTSRSLQERVNSWTKQQPEDSHSIVRVLAQRENLETTSHKMPSSLGRVQSEKVTAKVEQEKVTRRNASFSFDGGLRSEERTVYSEGQKQESDLRLGEKTVYSEGQKQGTSLQHNSTSSSSLLASSSPSLSSPSSSSLLASSSPSLSSPSSSSTSTAVPAKAEILGRRYLSSRSINVIRPGEIEMARDEETETGDGHNADDVNAKAEAFIAKVKEQMRLQTVELAEREKKKRLARGI